MLLNASAEVRDSKLKWPSDNYILKSPKYDVSCKILKEDIGILRDKYELRLKGKPKNVRKFISFLKKRGFKVKY